MGKVGLCFGVAALTLVMGCAPGHCRRKAEAPGTAKAPDAEAPATSGGAGVAFAKGAAAPTSTNVLVYKYDGSLQCGMGKAIALDVMAKELQGIPVISSIKKPDGMMHIQVCGSITGMANVYEIPAKNLKQAEGRGFKRWSFE